MLKGTTLTLLVHVLLLSCDTAVECFAFVSNKSRFRFEKSFSRFTEITRSSTATRLNFACSDDALSGFGIPSGLRDTLITNARDGFQKRVWLVDNSGSMKMWDGHLVLNRDTGCTRWDEAKETITCHAQLSAALGAPTDFRLLNPSKSGETSFRVGYGSRIQRDSKRAQAIMAKSQPAGMTPLHTRIYDIRREVIQMLPQLNKDGSKVALIVCTDGCNFDAASPCLEPAEMNREFLQALESLEGLPVYVVIRLCTDFGPIVDFYNSLNERLDLKLNVLDDHMAEALEVNRHNKWLNYALVLHRMREMGQSNLLFDLLDERPFTKDEIRDFIHLLFGPQKLPDPASCDWVTFCQEVDKLQQAERMHWNPLTKELSPWINVDELELEDCIDVDEFVEESV